MASIHPQSTKEVATAIKLAVTNQKRICLRRSAAASDSADLLQLSRLKAIVDYPFDDMTVTVQAGITCSELSTVLAAHNQQLPIDVHLPDTTIGQLVSANLFGPRICGYGTIRDYLIGIQAIDGAGRIFKAGGKVVKNVAGYDLCRLMIGSQGRLAVITECTFKLNPIPASTSAIRMSFDFKSDLAATLQALNSSNARPTFIDVHSSPQSKPYAELAVGVEGSGLSCKWQLNRIQQECKTSAVETMHSSQVAEYLSNSNHFWAANQQCIRVRRSQVAKVADQLIHAQQPIHGYAADGFLYCSEDAHVSSILHEQISAGAVHIFKHDSNFAHHDHPLNNRLLNTFDPHGIFADVQNS